MSTIAQPSMTDMQADLDATARDIDRLEEIVTNLRAFINDSHGENRLRHMTNLVWYDGLLKQAFELRAKIIRHMTESIQADIVAAITPSGSRVLVEKRFMPRQDDSQSPFESLSPEEPAPTKPAQATITQLPPQT